MIKLSPLAVMTAAVQSISTTGRMPFGVRQVYIVSGGTVTGDRIKGTILPGGGDFLLVDPSGLGHVDARLTWQTGDGAHIYVQYDGRVVMSEVVGNAFKSGGACNFGDTYFITQLRFETGDSRYAWLNGTMALGEGRVAENRSIQYNIYACEHAK